MEGGREGGGGGGGGRGGGGSWYKLQSHINFSSVLRTQTALVCLSLASQLIELDSDSVWTFAPLSVWLSAQSLNTLKTLVGAQHRYFKQLEDIWTSSVAACWGSAAGGRSAVYLNNTCWGGRGRGRERPLYRLYQDILTPAVNSCFCIRNQVKCVFVSVRWIL